MCAPNETFIHNERAEGPFIEFNRQQLTNKMLFVLYIMDASAQFATSA